MTFCGAALAVVHTWPLATAPARLSRLRDKYTQLAKLGVDRLPACHEGSVNFIVESFQIAFN